MGKTMIEQLKRKREENIRKMAQKGVPLWKIAQEHRISEYEVRRICGMDYD